MQQLSEELGYKFFSHQNLPQVDWIEAKFDHSISSKITILIFEDSQTMFKQAGAKIQTDYVNFLTRSRHSNFSLVYFCHYFPYATKADLVSSEFLSNATITVIFRFIDRRRSHYFFR